MAQVAVFLKRAWTAWNPPVVTQCCMKIMLFFSFSTWLDDTTSFQVGCTYHLKSPILTRYKSRDRDRYCSRSKVVTGSPRHPRFFSEQNLKKTLQHPIWFNLFNDGCFHVFAWRLNCFRSMVGQFFSPQKITPNQPQAIFPSSHLLRGRLDHYLWHRLS